MEFLSFFFFLFVFPPLSVSLLFLPSYESEEWFVLDGKKILVFGLPSPSCLTHGSRPGAEGPEAGIVDLVINSLNYSGSCSTQRGRKGNAQQGVPEPRTLDSSQATKEL